MSGHQRRDHVDLPTCRARGDHGGGRGGGRRRDGRRGGCRRRRRRARGRGRGSDRRRRGTCGRGGRSAGGRRRSVGRRRRRAGRRSWHRPSSWWDQEVVVVVELGQTNIWPSMASSCVSSASRRLAWAPASRHAGQSPAMSLVVASSYLPVAVLRQVGSSKVLPLKAASAALLLHLAIEAHSLRDVLAHPVGALELILRGRDEPGVVAASGRSGRRTWGSQ